MFYPDKPSLFTSRYLSRIGYQADYEKFKIRSKRKTISQISRAWQNISVDFELRLEHRGVTHRSLRRSVHVCLVVKCGWHGAYINGNSDNSNQRVTSECDVSCNLLLAKSDLLPEILF